MTIPVGRDKLTRAGMCLGNAHGEGCWGRRLPGVF